MSGVSSANGPPRGWRTVALGAALGAFALLPMGAALFSPDESAFPSGRLPAFLAGATFFSAAVWITASGLGRSSRFPVAALLSGFAGVPVAMTMADVQLATDALTTPWLSIAQSLLLGGIAATVWAGALREWARDARASGVRRLAVTAAGLVLLSPVLGSLGPLAAVTGLAAPLVASASLAAGSARTRLLGIASTLAALPLVVAPARAALQLIQSLVDLPQTYMRLPLVADPDWSGAIDLAAATAALGAVGMTVAARRLRDGELRDRAVLLPDLPHAMGAALLAAGLAAGSAVTLRPELAPWNGSRLASGAREMPAEVRRALLRLESRDPDVRADALTSLADVDADLGPATDHLLALLEHADPGARQGAATVLRLRGSLESTSPQRRDALARCLSSPERELRRLALLELPGADPGDRELLRAVIRGAFAEDAELRDAALAAVATSGATGTSVLREELEQDEGKADAALLRALVPAMQVTERLALHRERLEHPRSGARWYAVQGLAELSAEAPGVAADLERTLGDADAGVRQVAFRAISDHFPDRLAALDPDLLASFLDSSLWADRVDARKALEQQGDPLDAVLPALLRTLETGDTYAREEAMAHLLRLGDAPVEAVPLVAAAIEADSRQGLRAAGADLLGSMGERAAPAAKALAGVAVGQDTYAAGHALDALEAIGPAARDALPLLEQHAATLVPMAPRMREAIESISGVDSPHP